MLMLRLVSYGKAAAKACVCVHVWGWSRGHTCVLVSCHTHNRLFACMRNKSVAHTGVDGEVPPRHVYYI